MQLPRNLSSLRAMVFTAPFFRRLCSLNAFSTVSLYRPDLDLGTRITGIAWDRSDVGKASQLTVA
jgi:hypothetical protein